MPYYFAYGSNMSSEQIDVRCNPDKPKKVGIGTLSGYKFIIYWRGYANIFEVTGSEVIGVVWEVHNTSLDKLDSHEGVAEGLYTRETVTVQVAAKGVSDCFVYIDRNPDFNVPGKPQPGYINKLVQAAKAVGLSGEYINHLKSFRK
jgi:cation transport regulator ChaC